MRAIEFIFESYPLAKKEFSQVANPTEVQATIDQYRELVRKNQFRNPEEKNINYWRRLGWEAFSQMVKIKSGDVTDSQMKKGKVLGNAITLQDDAEWVVLIPLDKETSVHYGRGTEWCTTKPYWAYFEDYVYTRNITLIYAIDKTKSGRSVAISIKPDTDEGEKINMFNQADDPIDASIYKQISGLDPNKFIQMAKLPENQQQLADSIEKYKVAKAKTAELLKASPLDPEAIERELKITKDKDDCGDYIVAYSKEQNSRVRVHPSIVVAVSTHDTTNKKINLGQYIDFTSIPIGILRSMCRTAPEFILYNAAALTPNQQIVFTEYETTIKDDPEKSYQYAEIFNKPFPLGEPAIVKSTMHTLDYYYNILKKHHSPSWEQLIKDDPKKSYQYAEIFNKPFPLGEPAILRSEEYTQHYYQDILKKHHSPSWEQLIKDDPENSLKYADTFNKPFPLGEPAIASDIQTSIQYIMKFAAKSSTWENVIKDNPEVAYFYAFILKKRFPEGEAAIATNTELATSYDSQFGTNLSQQ